MSFLEMLFYSTIIPMGSWTIGLMLNAMVMNLKCYQRLSHLNFIKSSRVNRAIGVYWVKWGATKTVFKFFNPGLRFSNAAGLARLQEARLQMTHAEIGHLIAFVAVTLFAGFALWQGKALFAGLLMLMNLFLNLHPSLLQQENKRRIDRLIARYY